MTPEYVWYLRIIIPCHPHLRAPAPTSCRSRHTFTGVTRSLGRVTTPLTQTPVTLTQTPVTLTHTPVTHTPVTHTPVTLTHTHTHTQVPVGRG